MSFKKGGQILLAKLHSATRKSTVIFSSAYVRRRNRGWNLLCRYEENFLPADLVLSKFTWDMDYQCRLLFEDLKSACKNIKKKKKSQKQWLFSTAEYSMFFKWLFYKMLSFSFLLLSRWALRLAIPISFFPMAILFASSCVINLLHLAVF